MRSPVLAALAAAILLAAPPAILAPGAARAQATVPAAGAPPAPATAPTAGPTAAPAPPGRTAPAPTARAPNLARDACRTEIDAKSLTGEERRAGMRECMHARVESCRGKAAAAGVPRGDGERRAFVRRCVQEGA